MRRVHRCTSGLQRQWQAGLLERDHADVAAPGEMRPHLRRRKRSVDDDQRNALGSPLGHDAVDRPNETGHALGAGQGRYDHRNDGWPSGHCTTLSDRHRQVKNPRPVPAREPVDGTRMLGPAMEVDTRTLDSSSLDADVCIVGAGPAGLTVARALAASGLRIILLESGGRGPDSDAQALCDGTTSGDTYAGPGATRHRQAGGTAQVWNTWLGADAEIGGKYVPLDTVDFEAREWLPLSGWPFDKASLAPYYERAQALCGLGPYVYRGVDWASPDRLPLALLVDVSLDDLPFAKSTDLVVDDV